MLCNKWSIATKCNDNLTFQCAIDYWVHASDRGMPGAILSFNVITTRGFSSHNCVPKSKQRSEKENWEF